ncbi:hypothetical protein RFI_02151, partial [Reticulomyxa filosa]
FWIITFQTLGFPLQNVIVQDSTKATTEIFKYLDTQNYTVGRDSGRDIIAEKLLEILSKDVIVMFIKYQKHKEQIHMKYFVHKMYIHNGNNTIQEKCFVHLKDLINYLFVIKFVPQYGIFEREVKDLQERYRKRYIHICICVPSVSGQQLITALGVRIHKDTLIAQRAIQNNLIDVQLTLKELVSIFTRTCQQIKRSSTCDGNVVITYINTTTTTNGPTSSSSSSSSNTTNTDSSIILSMMPKLFKLVDERKKLCADRRWSTLDKN